ncbi:MAG: hypothetical protein HJJLKODD_02460 [Phycisphaerae bacterium]|nr:hypothetical protein [Phycisphaerae bacterium]
MSSSTVTIHPRVRVAVEKLNLTLRQAQIVGAYAECADLNNLSEQMGISVSTLRTHLRNIFGVLNISSRAELLALVLKRVLHELDEHAEAGKTTSSFAPLVSAPKEPHGGERSNFTTASVSPPFHQAI